MTHAEDAAMWAVNAPCGWPPVHVPICPATRALSGWLTAKEKAADRRVQRRAGARTWFKRLDCFPRNDHYADSYPSAEEQIREKHEYCRRALATIVKRTVGRRPNAELRPREYLMEKEIERLIEAARKHGRYGPRDATAILLAYRHALRATELCELTWDMIELDGGRIHVRRSKNGVDSTHPLTGKEIRALRQLRRENLQGRYVFNTERGSPVTRAWFLKMLNRLGVVAKLPFQVHPHMLRHACGFKLANDGVDTRALQHYLGHKNIQHTVRYTELRSDRFNGFWKD